MNIRVRIQDIKEQPPIQGLIKLPPKDGFIHSEEKLMKIGGYIHQPDADLKKWEDMDPLTVIKCNGFISLTHIDPEQAKQFEIGKDYNILILSI